MDADAIIIGAGIGGVTTGALLAARGLRVLILEQGERPGGMCAYFSRNGYVFQSVAGIYSGFELGGGHDRVLFELGLSIRKTALNPGLQLILPQHRLNLYTNRIELLGELEREFPKGRARIKSFLDVLDQLEEVFSSLSRKPAFRAPHTLADKYSYYRKIHQVFSKTLPSYEASPAGLLNELIENPGLKQALDLLAFYYGQQPLKECSTLYCAYLLGIPKRGIVYLKGGAQGLIDLLVDFIRKHKGEVRCSSRVDKILKEGRRAIGVQLQDGQTLRSKYVIANTTLENLHLRLLGETRLSKKIKQLTENVSPRWLPFSVYLGLDANVLPGEIRENVLLTVDPEKPLGGTNTLFISISPADDNTRAPQGKRAVTVSCFLPKENWARDDEYHQRKERLETAVIQSLQSLITFVGEGINYKESATPLTYEKYTLRPRGGIISLAGTRSGFGINGYSNYTPYKNLYLVGDSSFPGQGTNLVSISALNLARIICS